MRDPDKKPPYIVALRLRYRDTYDAVSMAIYLVAVYIWGISIHPMGRDFEALSSAGRGMPFLAGPLFRAEMALFGTWLPGYHVVNMVILYGCMICIYHLTNMTLRGLWWFGTLAACLFMANPVHSEAVLNLCGVEDLVPCLIALAALAGYAWQVQTPRPWKMAISLVIFALASFPYAANSYLVLVILFYELLATPTGKHSFARLGAFLAVGVIGVLLHLGTLFSGPFHPTAMFTPLYFIFYPLGFLPETTMAFQARPWLGWVAAAVVAGILLLIYRKARRPVILFALLSMIALRLCPGNRPIDTTTLIGGGQLLLPNALFVVGLVALFFRIMDHPKWRVSMVGITTTLVIVLFAMQFISVRRWHEAGLRVQAFQTKADSLWKKTGQPVAVLPDYQAYYGAPMRFSEAVAYDTPFSRAVPAIGILPLNAERRDRLNVSVENWGPSGGQVQLTGKPALNLEKVFPKVGLLLKAGDKARVSELYWHVPRATADATVRLDAITKTTATLTITEPRGDLLTHTTPSALPNGSG